MNYEYENINRAIVQQNGVDNNINRANSLQELDEVYAQAAKADEYEAKSKAFDAILKAYDEALSEGHLADDVCNIVEKYESGETKVYKCTCGARYWSMVNYKEHLTNCFDG